MIKSVQAGTKLFRSRQHSVSLTPSTAIDLGTPPAELAVFSNRMSPAGIPMFYAARDPATARAETEVADPEKPEMSTAIFTNTEDMRVLDLANLPAVPSLFDDHKRHLRTGLKFIHGFSEDLALPIHRNGQEHIEYVPTQIVSEYFRTVFNASDDDQLDGLCYRSVKKNGGVSICLFLTHADFLGSGPHAKRVPKLIRVDKFRL